MTRRNRAVLAAALAGALLQAACGGKDPSRVDRPPVVEGFQPADRHIDAFVGDTLRFSINASDPDRDNLATRFFVDGTPVGEGEFWDYAVLDTGLVDIRGQVADGEHMAYIEWQVEGAVPVNFPPVIGTTLPVELNPTLVIGNTMNFSVIATDPEMAPLTYSFSVNDSFVVSDRNLTYLGSSVGPKLVRVVVSDGDKSAAHEWQLKVTTVPDNIPPAPVMITLAETGVQPGEINIEWTAVGRDGMFGKPSIYQVRTSPVPILTEQDWARGSDRPGVPPTAFPGETMRMVVGGLQPARLTYVAVRATDDFGNISAIQAPVNVLTRGMRFGGRVIDTVTYRGIPNARVAFGNEFEITDSEGVFEFVEQGFGDGLIFVRDEDGAEIGGYYNYDKPYSAKHLDVVNLYMLPNYPMATTTYYIDFLAFYKSMTDVPLIPYGSDQRRRELPIALYCREHTNQGLDYAATITAVGEELAGVIGSPVFYPAPDPLPAARVETTYNGVISRDRYSIKEWSPDYYPLAGLIEFRVLYTPSTVEPFKQIIRHEFGHALGLNHSTDPGHLMIGFVAASVPTFTPDEVALLRSYYCIPRGWDMRRYTRD